VDPYPEDGEETTMATMPIAKLQDLHSRVEAAINEKVSQRRRELEAELSKLARFGGGEKAPKLGRGGPKGPAAAKYRNPEKPEETCAGRGLKPPWLTAAINGGKKLEDLSVPCAIVPTARPHRAASRTDGLSSACLTV
jgi:DNA-binding protein H-NS